MFTEELLVEQGGMTPEQARTFLREASEVAAALEQRIPDIGILSLRKRLNAYLVVTGHVSGLIERKEISADLATVAHSLLLSRNKPFRKCYQAFIAAWRSGSLTFGQLSRFAAMQLPQGS